MTDVLDGIAGLIGARHVLTDPADMAPHLREWRDLFRGAARAVAKPGSTGEVAAILKLAHETGTAIVPQGGNTGLVGGQIPLGEGREIVLSLARLDRIREVDAEGNAMIVEAGVTLLRAQEAAEAADRLFRSRSPPKAAAPSAATSPPMRAGRRCWPMATPATSASGSKSCWPMAASGRACASCARTTPATI